jgi:hypothetical protein
MEDSLSLDDWVIAIIGCQRMHKTKLFQKRDRADPGIAIQLLTQEVFRPSSPQEVFSDERPFFIPQRSEEDEWIPIDDVLGRYFPGTRKIEIYTRNIQQYADSPFGMRTGGP